MKQSRTFEAAAILFKDGTRLEDRRVMLADRFAAVVDPQQPQYTALYNVDVIAAFMGVKTPEKPEQRTGWQAM